MPTIHILLNKKLLQATDRAARKRNQTRSALIREALRTHLRHLEIADLEERDRRGYGRHPASPPDPSRWEHEAMWPAP